MTLDTSCVQHGAAQPSGRGVDTRAAAYEQYQHMFFCSYIGDCPVHYNEYSATLVDDEVTRDPKTTPHNNEQYINIYMYVY